MCFTPLGQLDHNQAAPAITNIIHKRVLIFKVVVSTSSVGRNPLNVTGIIKSGLARDYSQLNIIQQLKRMKEDSN